MQPVIGEEMKQSDNSSAVMMVKNFEVAQPKKTYNLNPDPSRLTLKTEEVRLSDFIHVKTEYNPTNVSAK